MRCTIYLLDCVLRLKTKKKRSQNYYSGSTGSPSNKTFLPAFIAWWKSRRTFERIREQISRGFSSTRGFSQTGYEGTSGFIALWKHTCWPIKMHVPSKLFYKTSCCCLQFRNYRIILRDFWTATVSRDVFSSGRFLRDCIQKISALSYCALGKRQVLLRMP